MFIFAFQKYFWEKIKIFLVFLDHFDALISKIIFFKKNIILIYFLMKNTLKSNYNHAPKQALRENKNSLQY